MYVHTYIHTYIYYLLIYFFGWSFPNTMCPVVSPERGILGTC